MSTKAMIMVVGLPDVALYKHWDGMPKSTLPWLEEFNMEFQKKRGDDPEYKFAQLIRSSVFLAEKHGLDKDNSTGWGVLTKNLSGITSINYKYFLQIDGTVTYLKGN